MWFGKLINIFNITEHILLNLTSALTMCRNILTLWATCLETELISETTKGNNISSFILYLYKDQSQFWKSLIPVAPSYPRGNEEDPYRAQ